MANNEVSYTIDTSGLEPVFVSEFTKLPEGTITIDSSVAETEYTLSEDFLTFNTTSYKTTDISVTFGSDTITIDTKE